MTVGVDESCRLTALSTQEGRHRLTIRPVAATVDGDGTLITEHDRTQTLCPVVVIGEDPVGDLFEWIRHVRFATRFELQLLVQRSAISMISSTVSPSRLCRNSTMRSWFSPSTRSTLLS